MTGSQSKFTSSVSEWLYPRAEGLYCAPGDFFIDPVVPVERAIVTHGHADHARAGHLKVLATVETLAIMRTRYGPDFAACTQALALGSRLVIGDVTVWLAPAGHILGSAQVVLEHRGRCAVVSGDYKRQPDPTCTPFELVRCDVFVTEATFGLPVFRHGDARLEVAKLLRSQTDAPERTHLVGVYGLGKCQRVIRLLREFGYDRPIWLHGALQALSDLYVDLGVDLGDIRPVPAEGRRLAGEIVLCPPSALQDRWSRRMENPLTAFASGWMRVRARARQRGVELPLIISDHVDWPELLETIKQTEAEEIWVTHGREDAVVHQANKIGLKAKALRLVGREEDGA